MAELFEILAKGSISSVATSGTQIFNDATFTVIDAFDTINVQRGGITCNVTTNVITVSETGTYTLEAGINAEFGVNDELQIQGHVDGSPIGTGGPFAIQGAGAGKPVIEYWVSHGIPLTAGNILDLRAKNGDAGNLQPSILRVSLTVTKDSP